MSSSDYIRKIINSKSTSFTSKTANFNLMIGKESFLRIVEDRSDVEGSKFLYQSSELRKLFVNVLDRDTIDTALDYSKPMIKVTKVKNYNQNIFYLEPENDPKKFIIITDISIITDDKNFNGITFGFVDDKQINKIHFNLGYSTNYINPNDEDKGTMTKYKSIAEVIYKGETLNLSFHTGVVAFIKAERIKKDKPKNLNRYDKLIEKFKLDYDINPNMLLYVKTFKNGKLDSINDEPAIIWINGKKEWYKNGLLHRDNDKAAVEYDSYNTFKAWFQNGRLHRENGPAVFDNRPYSLHHDEWWFNGLRHRDFGPAYTNEDKEDDIKLVVSWQYGLKHNINNSYQDYGLSFMPNIRNDGPAYILIRKGTIVFTRTQKWYKYNLLDRDDDPAVIEEKFDKDDDLFKNPYSVIKNWYSKGLFHRNDGPAVISKFREETAERYYIHGDIINDKEEYKRLINKE